VYKSTTYWDKSIKNVRKRSRYTGKLDRYKGLVESSGKDYWRIADISDLVEEMSGIKYTRRHIRRLMLRWGYSLITPRKKHSTAASDEEVENFKKIRRDNGISEEGNDGSMHG
jgi:transposase